MQVELKRIKTIDYDDLKKSVVDHFLSTKVIYMSDDILENSSESVLVDGNKVVVDYSIEEYENIVNEDIPNYMKLAKLGMLLHRESKDISGLVIPSNVWYEKEVWAYLSFKVFGNVLKKLKLEDDDKITEGRIERVYFNGRSTSRSGMSRTGLLFVWSMIDILGSEDDYSFSETAFHFVDPVKAVYERDMSKNFIILRAFVQAIINNGCDDRIKNKINRTRVPNNISCMARINVLDAYTYDDLVSVLTDKIAEVIQM